MSSLIDRRLARAILAGVGVPLLILVSAGPVGAHSVVVRTDPPDGSVLTDPPDRIRLVFSQPISGATSTFELVGTDGGRVALPPATVDPADPRVVVIDLPALPTDAYRLSWVGSSDYDLHPIEGTLVFGIGQPAPAGGVVPDGPSVSLIEVVTRTFDVLVIAALVGAFVLWSAGGSEPRHETF